MKKNIFKKSSEELQEYLQFRKRGFKVEPKKGKGSYKRKSKYNKLP
jgi:stalled ribosome alternative rescue factor ArfA